MRFSHRNVTWPWMRESILDVQPASDGTWAVLTREGVFAILDDSGMEARSQGLSLNGLDLERPVVLQVSRDLRFAAVVEEFGTQGFVADLNSGQTLMRLTRGDYCVQCCSFPVAFFEHQGRTLIVHGTDWNRLDISDPLTGGCLTDRPSPQYEEAGPEPEHYLDYFHSRLCVSPDQTSVFDNGWIWHPLGAPRIWSLGAWLSENVWESEDGASVRELHTGGHMWDAPMAWIDSQTLIVWGLGEDLEEDDPLRPGIRIFDAITGEEKAIIEGVQVEPHELTPRDPAREGWIAFDQWLYAISPVSGTTIWDIEERRCLHHDPDFAPRRYHPVSQSFLSLDGLSVRVGRLDNS